MCRFFCVDIHSMESADVEKAWRCVLQHEVVALAQRSSVRDVEAAAQKEASSTTSCCSTQRKAFSTSALSIAPPKL